MTYVRASGIPFERREMFKDRVVFWKSLRREVIFFFFL